MIDLLDCWKVIHRGVWLDLLTCTIRMSFIGDILMHVRSNFHSLSYKLSTCKWLLENKLPFIGTHYYELFSDLILWDLPAADPQTVCMDNIPIVNHTENYNNPCLWIQVSHLLVMNRRS